VSNVTGHAIDYDARPSTIAAVRDRPIKRRFEILFGRYTLNPLIRSIYRVGLTPPRMALIETVGRKSGQVRHTPVFAMREGQTVWLIAQHGAHAGWVRNFLAQPEVRIRIGRHWLSGTASLQPGDDVRARTRSFATGPVGKTMMVAMFRTLESQPVTAKVELAPA
jgi:deazaflavin-dependent oxidoreductase (nitroreductase family)